MVNKSFYYITVTVNYINKVNGKLLQYKYSVWKLFILNLELNQFILMTKCCIFVPFISAIFIIIVNLNRQC